LQETAAMRAWVAFGLFLFGMMRDKLFLQHFSAKQLETFIVSKIVDLSAWEALRKNCGRMS